MKPFRLQTRVLSPPLVAPVHRSYAVPWRVVARSASGVIEFEQCGEAPLRVVRFMLAGEGLLGLSLPRTVHPGQRVRLVIRGVYADGVLRSPEAMLVVRWMQGDGTELLWPVAL